MQKIVRSRISILLVWFLVGNGLWAEPLNQWFYSKDQLQWNPVTLPYNFADDEEDSETDIYFMKYRFALDEFDPNVPLSMRLGVILDREKLKLNGSFLNQGEGWNNELPLGYDRVRIYDLPPNLLLWDQPNEIQLEIKRYFADEVGIGQDRFEIGSSKKIWEDFYREEMIPLGFLIVYATVAAYFGFLYFRRKQETEYLYFSLFSFNLILYQFFRTQTKFILPMEFWELKKMEYLVLPTLIPLMAHFLRKFLNHRYTPSMKALDLGIIAVVLYFVLNGDIRTMDKVNRWILQPLWLGYVIHEVGYVVRAIQQKNQDAIWIGSGLSLILLSGFVDILNSRLLWHIPRLTGYVFLGNVLFQAFILANRFVRLHQKVEEWNLGLEQKVKERTIELENSLEEIQKLKEKQDGDYFLTTLLLKPLHKIVNPNLRNDPTNQEDPIPNPHPIWRTESTTRQKKSFVFNKKEHMIGGDLTLTDNMELNGEDYLLFVNSDAMGKSIQGAGGALVLGVVIQSLLAKKNVGAQKNKYPERWLKDAFLDLQKAFETFDGSMYISLVMGLVHKDTGYVYYYNAEHPQPILFRDGEARFLAEQDSATLHKIGVPENEKNFSVATFQMQAGDRLILGTDGRDDILREHDDPNDWRMNEDENLILQIVESAEGEISKIREILETQYQLTDDLSLLGVIYQPKNVLRMPYSRTAIQYLRKGRNLAKKGKYQEAVRELEKLYLIHPSHSSLCLALGSLHCKLKNYQLALEYFQKTSQIRPDKTESIYWEAYCLKKIGLVQSAIDTAERLRLRDPKNKEVLDLLESLYKTHYVKPSFVFEVPHSLAA